MITKRGFIFVLFSDDAGTVDTDDKKKDQNQGQEEADESTPIEEKIDYEQQPPEDIDPVVCRRKISLRSLLVLRFDHFTGRKMKKILT